MKPLQKDCKPTVIKIGASLMYAGDGGLDLSFISRIVAEICALKDSGQAVILVSSGAIAMGMSLLGLNRRPQELAHLQAIAAVGQNELMNIYRRLFSKYGLNCGQVLLTWEDFRDRKRYLNVKNTLLTLLKLGVVPVVNENDTVSTEEIKFGDNDRLSALVAALVGAGLLIILSDVEGLLDKDKKIVRVVPEINSAVRALAYSTDKKTCVGGMITKIEAAKIAMDSGIPCVIANGRQQRVISSLVGDSLYTGTLFLPKQGHLAEKQRWLAFGSRPKGKIIVDEGAKNALCNKKSLLAVGVLAVEGDFESADIVSVVDAKNNEFARGKSGFSSKQLEKAKGTRHAKEVIHRDNIVIL